jgi:hypothetical protein
LNLYDTDQRFQSNPLQFDCLNYRIRRETLAYQDLSDVIDEVIPYYFHQSLLVIIWCLFVPQMIYLHVFYDDMEERSWCVVKYVGWLAKYSTSLIFVHYFVPLAINTIWIICIILLSAYRRSLLKVEYAVGIIYGYKS